MLWHPAAPMHAARDSCLVRDPVERGGNRGPPPPVMSSGMHLGGANLGRSSFGCKYMNDGIEGCFEA